MIVCQTSIFLRKCFATIFHLQQIWWSVIKGSLSLPPEFFFFFIIFPIIPQGHRWALKASQVQGVKQSKVDKNEDVGITDEKLTAFYILVVNVGGGAREESEKEGVKTGARKGRVKEVINLMEKSNTKQIHSSKLGASVTLFSACAKPRNKLSLLIDCIWIVTEISEK